MEPMSPIENLNRRPAGSHIDGRRDGALIPAGGRCDVGSRRRTQVHSGASIPGRGCPVDFVATLPRRARSTSTWTQVVAFEQRADLRDQGAEIGRRIDGRQAPAITQARPIFLKSTLRPRHLRAAAGIYAAFIVADHSKSSDITRRFIEQIFSADQQPKEKGLTDLSNGDQLASVWPIAPCAAVSAGHDQAGAPHPLRRPGDGYAIASNKSRRCCCNSLTWS